MAIKLLPPALTTDEDAWRASSAKRGSWRHWITPNIASVYGLEEIEGTNS